MAQPAAIIRIKNLRLCTFIGIKEEEINNRQDIVIHLKTIHQCRSMQDFGKSFTTGFVMTQGIVNFFSSVY